MAIYAINTNRKEIDEERKSKGISTCDLWFEHGMAFAGGFIENKGGKYANLFRKINVEDIILMYHSGKGYVGVGKVISAWSDEEKK